MVSRSATDPALGLDVRKAFAMLPEAYREPLLLQVLGGLSSAEIAASTESTEEAVNMRLSRARRALREMLGDSPVTRAPRKEVQR